MTDGGRRALAVRVLLVVIVVAAAATVLVIVRRNGRAAASGPAVDPSVAGTAAAGLAPADIVAPPADPARWIGPQGRTGQFVAHCPYSHSAPDDPIVQFGKPGRSHRHDFYGATATDASSTAATLQAGASTCDKPADTAAYWQPTLYDHGEVVVPVEAQAYYRAAPGIDPTTVVAMPSGLALIAGDQTATEPQPGEATGWTCGASTRLTDDPPTCTDTAPLHLVLTFADCWDGVHLDAEDHHAHVRYSTDGACPASHPVSIPQLTVSIKFPIWGAGHDLTLASGSIYSAHGDFLNGWGEAGLEREVAACIHRGAVCDLASNREEEALFSYGT